MAGVGRFAWQRGSCLLFANYELTTRENTNEGVLKAQRYVVLLHGFTPRLYIRRAVIPADILLSMMNSDILHAYRHLFRAALRAVRYSSPAKYQIRDTMRTAFRTGELDSFDNRRVENTLRFLQRAELYAGMEHKILRNLLHVKYWRNYGRRDNKLLVTACAGPIWVLTLAE